MWRQWIAPVLGAAFVMLVAHRIWRSAENHSAPAHAGAAMPSPLADDAARALYFTPGGLYTQADIEANGDTTAAKRYAGFRAQHDADPRPGDPLCPITRTKANATCVWVVGGREYRFCCPPCIDEFVRLAKERPEAVHPPAAYVEP